jgi:hypothetical protein
VPKKLNPCGLCTSKFLRMGRLLSAPYNFLTTFVDKVKGEWGVEAILLG